MLANTAEILKQQLTERKDLSNRVMEAANELIAAHKQLDDLNGHIRSMLHSEKIPAHSARFLVDTPDHTMATVRSGLFGLSAPASRLPDLIARENVTLVDIIDREVETHGMPKDAMAWAGSFHAGMNIVKGGSTNAN